MSSTLAHAQASTLHGGVPEKEHCPATAVPNTGSEGHRIHLSLCRAGVANTAIEPWSLTFDELNQVLSSPVIGTKDGSYFVRGACGTPTSRNDTAITSASVIVLDGDKSIDPDTGELTTGAPSPELVHQVLKHLDIAHILYTSYSHLEEGKGNRFRVVVMPDRPLKTSLELHACVDWLIDRLHQDAVYLATVLENYAWSQPWYLPRLRSDQAEFEYFSHDGLEYLSVDSCCAYFERKIVTVADQVAKICDDRQQPVHDSLIGRYNAQHGSAEQLLQFLEERSYTLFCTSKVNGEIAYRLLAPGSESNRPGVVVFKSKLGPWRVCSHHGEHDPLARLDPVTGKKLAHDAFDVFRILTHGGNERHAVSAWRDQCDPRPKIKICGGSISRNVQDGIRALGQEKPTTVFQRGSLLVRVAHLPEAGSIQGCSLPKGTAVIVELNAHFMVVCLAVVAKWQRAVEARGGGIEWVDTDPTAKIAQGILTAQGRWHGIPVLKAIAETPVLRRDGSLHDTVGYDDATGLYYEGSCPQLLVGASPSLDDARAAADQLLSVFSEFPIVDKELGKSITLAYLMTLVLRGQLPIAPLFAVSATTPGTGKGLWIEVCNLIVRGRDAAIMPPVSGSGSEEEIRKRITALLLQGATSVNLDNWTTAIGGDSLNGLLTANEWSDRVLGRSEAVKLPNRVTWAATGNNLTVRGDMTRRTILIRLDARVERPELREFGIKNLPQYVLEHRTELLSALFTILRAYRLAGVPEESGKTLGRFEEWSRAVCAPIRWLGYPDPITSQEQLRKDDPETDKLGRLLAACSAVFGERPFTVADLTSDFFPIDEALELHMTLRKNWSLLHEALEECAPEKIGGRINRRSLGWYLKNFSGRIVAGLVLQRLEGEAYSVPTYQVCHVF